MNMTTLTSIGCLLAITISSGCLSYSHYCYSKRAESARALPEGVKPRPGRLYFASFPENQLALSILEWQPCIGHAALMTRDNAGLTKQYDYGWFCGREEEWPPSDAIGYKGDCQGYGLVKRNTFAAEQSDKATNDTEVARMVLEHMGSDEGGDPLYGGKIVLWAKDVADVGIAERYLEQFAADENRGSMAWRCWQIGGYRCGSVTRQAFDAARGEGHFLDLLWGGFPGADAPSIGTDKTVYVNGRGQRN